MILMTLVLTRQNNLPCHLNHDTDIGQLLHLCRQYNLIFEGIDIFENVLTNIIYKNTNVPYILCGNVLMFAFKSLSTIKKSEETFLIESNIIKNSIEFKHRKK